MVADSTNRFHKLSDDVRRMADEVRLQLHLGSMEARELWSKLEPKLAQFEADSARMATGMSDDVRRGVGQLGEELEHGLARLQTWLRGTKPAEAKADAPPVVEAPPAAEPAKAEATPKAEPAPKA